MFLFGTDFSADSYFQFRNEDGSHHVLAVVKTALYVRHKQKIPVHRNLFSHFYMYKLPKKVRELQRKFPNAVIEVGSFDEHRVGLKPILRRVWAPIGERPIEACISPL